MAFSTFVRIPVRLFLALVPKFGFRISSSYLTNSDGPYYRSRRFNFCAPTMGGGGRYELRTYGLGKHTTDRVGEFSFNRSRFVSFSFR